MTYITADAITSAIVTVTILYTMNILYHLGKGLVKVWSECTLRGVWKEQEGGCTQEIEQSSQEPSDPPCLSLEVQDREGVYVWETVPGKGVKFDWFVSGTPHAEPIEIPVACALSWTHPAMTMQLERDSVILASFNTHTRYDAPMEGAEWMRAARYSNRRVWMREAQS